MVCKGEKVYDFGHKFSKEGAGAVSGMRSGRAYGDQVKDHRETLHGMFELLWRVQGIVTVTAEGATQGYKESVRCL